MNKIAVGGVGGSGTRLVAELLAECGLFIGAETNPASDNLWFTFLLRRPDWPLNFPNDSEIVDAIGVFYRCMQRTENTTFSDEDRTYVENVLQVWESHGHNNLNILKIAKSITNLESCRQTNQPWAWKEPNTLIYLPWLKDTIPDLKYIHVIRNGFDMAFSRNQNQLKTWGKYFGLEPSNEQPLPSQSLDYWINSNNRAIETGKSKFGNDFLVVNYDELVHNPVENIKRIMNFSGLAEDMLIAESLATKISPRSTGRHKEYDSSTFSQSQINKVIELGFSPQFKDMKKTDQPDR